MIDRSRQLLPANLRAKFNKDSQRLRLLIKDMQLTLSIDRRVKRHEATNSVLDAAKQVHELLQIDNSPHTIASIIDQASLCRDAVNTLKRRVIPQLKLTVNKLEKLWDIILDETDQGIYDKTMLIAHYPERELLQLRESVDAMRAFETYQL